MGNSINGLQSPYVQAKRGRLETRNRWDVGTNLFKGTISTWPKYVTAHFKGEIEPKYTTGPGLVPRLHRFIYDNRLSRYLYENVGGENLTKIAKGGKIGGNLFSFTGHYKRLMIDLEALDRTAPDNTSKVEFTAICADALSSIANMFTSASFALGIALCYRNPASRLAYGILLVQTAAVAWGESLTWIFNGAFTGLSEYHHNKETGEDNMSAYSSAAADMTTGFTTLFRNKFFFDEARAAASAGNLARANDIMIFQQADLHKKMSLGLFKIRASIATGVFMSATEAIRLGVEIYNLRKNYKALDDPDDRYGRRVREKNIESGWIGLASGVFTVLSIPFTLNYTLLPYAYACMAISCYIRANQSKYDHADEVVDKRAQV